MTKTGDFLVTHGLDEIVMNGQQNGFSGVGFGVGWLEGVKQ